MGEGSQSMEGSQGYGGWGLISRRTVGESKTATSHPKVGDGLPMLQGWSLLLQSTDAF